MDSPRRAQRELERRGAWLHVLTDLLGSVGALGAGAAIWAFGWRLADPIASVLIGLLVIYSSWALFKEAASVLLESAPTHVDVEALRVAIVTTPGVAEVHDLHVWTISSGIDCLSCHVVPVEGVAPQELLARLEAVLRERFGIAHTTIQTESAHCESGAVHR